LLVRHDLGTGAERDELVVATSLEQHAMQIAAMHDGIGIAESGAERLAEIDVADLAVGDGVHQAQRVDVDRHGARRFADSQMVEAMKRVGTELDASADLAELARLLEHQRGDALLCQHQSSREPADAAAGNQDPIAVHLPPCRRAAWRSHDRASRGYPTGFHRYVAPAGARASAAGAAPRRTATATRRPDNGRWRAGRGP